MWRAEETKKKMNGSCKKTGMGTWCLSKTRTEEQRKHMSEAQLRGFRKEKKKQDLSEIITSRIRL
jgi:hypothetical protein